MKCGGHRCSFLLGFALKKISTLTANFLTMLIFRSSSNYLYPLIMKSSQTSRIFQYFSNPRKFLIVNKSSPRFIDFSTVCNTAILQLIENHLSNVWKPHNHIVCHQTLGCEKLYCVAHAHPHFNN